MAVLNGSMGFFLQAESRPTITNHLPLILHGSTNSGVFAGLTLHTYADQYAQSVSGMLPLTVWHNTSETTTKSLNLSVTGDYWRANGSLDLTLWAASGVALGLNLYVAGSGGTAGAYPIEKGLNLHLERNPAATLNLFLQGPGTPGSGQLPLYVQGHEVATGSLDLSVPDVLGFASKTFNLYTHGF